MPKLSAPKTTIAALRALALASCVFGTLPPVQAQPARPAITGISHMWCVYASNLAASERFYGTILGGMKGADPLNPNGTRFYFSPTQFVEVLPLPAGHGISRVACVAYNTEDAAQLRALLLVRKIEGVGELHTASEGTRWFDVKDPEGNSVRLLQPGKSVVMSSAAKPIGTRVIHVGYVVHNRAAQDVFYKDLLGFKPYWFGSKQPDHVDWVSQQVPDGHDWLEYMMVGDGSAVPEAKVDARQSGVLNHFSIGVRNMEEAVTTLIREDRLSPRHDGPQMGLDGKWQANLYDPDGTRVELMEFQPVTKPCCSPFTAASPVN